MTQITISSNDMMMSILSAERYFSPMAKRQLRLWLKLKWFKRRHHCA